MFYFVCHTLFKTVYLKILGPFCPHIGVTKTPLMPNRKKKERKRDLEGKVARIVKVQVFDVLMLDTDGQNLH